LVLEGFNNSSNSQAIKVNFDSFCKSITLNSSNLEAKCNNIGVSIDLNKCFSNTNGKLVYASNGAYSKSCNSCSIKESLNPDKTKNYSLTCKCFDVKGGLKSSEINLNDFLYFNNKLECDDVVKLSNTALNINTSELEENCQNVNIKNGNTFTATCSNKGIEFNLNKCIGNFNGELALAENGNFGASCKNCEISLKNKVIMLSCSCADITNRFKTIESAINKFINFSGNTISCANQKSSILNVSTDKLPYNKNLSAAENFMILCKNVQIENNNKLIAFCGLNNIQVELNLNNCFSNIDGVLKVANNGFFAKTCKNCLIKYDIEDQYLLNCSCQKMNQIQWNNTFISLRERIIINENKNVLECSTNVKLPEDNLKEMCIKS